MFIFLIYHNIKKEKAIEKLFMPQKERGVANPPVIFFSIIPCRRRLFLKVVTNERRQKKTKISDVIRYMEFNVY